MSFEEEKIASKKMLLMIHAYLWILFCTAVHVLVPNINYYLNTNFFIPLSFARKSDISDFPLPVVMSFQ